MTALEWLVTGGGVVAIALVNWWFLGRWPGHKAAGDVHRH